MKIRVPNLKLPKLNIPPAQMITAVITFMYVFFCALILIPQIDYKSWYPDYLGTYDYNLSLSFYDHEKITIEKEPNNLDDKKVLNLVRTVYKRAEESRLKDIFIKNKKNSLEIHIPENISPAYINALIAPGRIEFKKITLPEDPEAQIDASLMMDPANYEYTGIKPYRIKDARITNVAQNNVYIELETDDDQIRRLTEISQEGSTFAVFVDGQMNLAYILPPNNVNTTNPTLVVAMEESQARVLISQILNDPLNISSPQYEFKASSPLYGPDLLITILTAIVLSMGIGFGYKALVHKTSLENLAGTVLLLGGLLTVIKFTSIIFTLPLLVLGVILVAALSFIRHKYYPTLSIAAIMIGFVLSQAPAPNMVNAFRLLIITGLYTSGFYILLYFLRIYED